MRRCVLHFGLHKTGSSSIQRFLRHDLRDRRFFYPASSDQPHLKDNCHNRPLCCAFQNHPEKYYSHAKEGTPLAELRARGEWFKNAMDRRFASPEAETLVLSAEELSNYETPELVRLLDFLHGRNLEVEAIGYVRRYKPLQESRFQQAVRSPGHLGKAIPPESRRYALFPYRQKLEKFSELLVRSAARIVSFESAIFSNDGMLGDFCRRVGIEQENTMSQRVNEGLGLDAVRLLYSFRKFQPTPSIGNDAMEGERRLVAKLAELKGARTVFHSSFFLKSESDWRSNVDWISERVGENMLGDLYADDDKDCVHGETDLFQYSKDSLDWLARETGVSFRSLQGGDPEKVAQAVARLKEPVVKQPKRAGLWERLIGRCG
jgi:hypothetical protein